MSSWSYQCSRQQNATQVPVTGMRRWRVKENEVLLSAPFLGTPLPSFHMVFAAAATWQEREEATWPIWANQFPSRGVMERKLNEQRSIQNCFQKCASQTLCVRFISASFLLLIRTDGRGAVIMKPFNGSGGCSTHSDDYARCCEMPGEEPTLEPGSSRTVCLIQRKERVHSKMRITTKVPPPKWRRLCEDGGFSFWVRLCVKWSATQMQEIFR